MQVRLDYGRTGLTVDLPDANVVKTLRYGDTAPLPDPAAAVAEAIDVPIGTPSLSEIARGRSDACILICDITRPVPNELILEPVLERLHEAGLPAERILILVATGLHRPNVGDELIEMVGRRIVDNYRIENHEGQRLESHAYLGESPHGVPIWIDDRFVQADLKITTGLIEPHFMAGFSGGRKLIFPGIAGIDSIRQWHSPRFLEHPSATSGVLHGNPVHEENTWIARHVGCDFMVNVVIDDQRRPLKFVAGDLIQAFEEGVTFVREVVTDTVPAPVDVVVTSGAGYPLDATFYQSVKGMVAALPIVKPGGTIVIAARIAEGIGSPEFQQIFADHTDLESFMRQIVAGEYFQMDQWQLEELAKVARTARIRVFSEGLPADKLEQLFVESCPSVEEAVDDALAEYGPDATIGVIPKGPYVMAQVAGNGAE